MVHRLHISDRAYTRDKACAAILSAPDGYTVVFERTMRLSSNSVRERALKLARALKSGWQVVLRKPNRTKEQNNKMWPMLTDLSVQKPLGRSYTPEQWKAVMMRACQHEIGYLLDINGEPFPYGYKSSDLKVAQMCDLITYIYKFGDEQGVVWSEPKDNNTPNQKDAA